MRFRLGDGPYTAAFEPGADGEVRIRLSDVGALPGRTEEGLRANPPRDAETCSENRVPDRRNPCFHLLGCPARGIPDC